MSNINVLVQAVTDNTKTVTFELNSNTDADESLLLETSNFEFYSYTIYLNILVLPTTLATITTAGMDYVTLTSAEKSFLENRCLITILIILKFY